MASGTTTSTVPTDTALAGFVQGVELAAVALYAQAAVVIASPAAVSVMATFAAHHRQHALAFAAVAGADAVHGPLPGVLEALSPSSLLVSERDGLGFLFALESRMASTHEYLLGRFTTVPAVSLSCTTVPVEAQHAAVLGTLLSMPLGPMMPTVQGVDGFLSPEQFASP